MAKLLVITVLVIMSWCLVVFIFNPWVDESITSINIDFYSKSPSQSFSIYYSDNNIFTRKKFITKELESNAQSSIINLPSEGIKNSNIRIDINDLEDSLEIASLVLVFQDGDSLYLEGSDIYSHITVTSDISMSVNGNILKIYPEINKNFRDCFFELETIYHIAGETSSLIQRDFFLNSIFLLFLALFFLRIFKEAEVKKLALTLSLLFLFIIFFKKAISYTIILFSYVVLSYMQSNKPIRLYNRQILVVACIYAIYICYTLFSWNNYIYKILVHQISLILFPIILALFPSQKSFNNSFNFAVKSVTLCALLLIFFFVVSYLFEYRLSILDFFYNAEVHLKYLFTVDGINFHPSFSSFALFAGLLYLLKDSHRGRRGLIYVEGTIGNIIIILLYVLLLFILGSKMTLLFGSLLMFFSLFKSRLKKQEVQNFKNIGAFVVILFILLFNILVYRFYLPIYDVERYHMWKASIEIVCSGNLEPISFVSFEERFALYLDKWEINEIKIFNHPHNQFLYFVVTFGLLPFFGFMVVVFFTLRGALKYNNWTLMIFLVGAYLFMTFDLLLNSIKGVSCFSLFYGLLVYDSSFCFKKTLVEIKRY